MKFGLWTQYGALNSGPVFDAFKHSIIQAGHTFVENNPNNDIDVIWSVLWNGRMAQNKTIWNRAQENKRPVIVLEVGGIVRGTTWKVGLNGINRGSFFSTNNNSDRATQLKINLKPWRTSGDYILICGQHDKSLQWQGLPSMSQWIRNTIQEIRNYTDRPIVVRPHPRCPIDNIEQQFKNVVKQVPLKSPGTYDNFDMRFNGAHAVINWSSNPGIHAVINGIPAFVGPNSLAYEVGNHSIANIENPLMPDRQAWLNDYAYTEWTIEEIAQGLPLKYLTELL